MLTCPTESPGSLRRASRLAPILAFGLSTFMLTAMAGADELKPFEASYTWIWHGMTVALSTLKLERRDDDTWVYRSKSEPRGIGHFVSARPRMESVMRVTTSASE